MNTLTKRILVALIGIPVVLALIYYGGAFFAAAVTIVSTIALWEFYIFTNKEKITTTQIFGLLINVILQVIIYLAIHSEASKLNSRFLAGILFAVLLALFTYQLFTREKDPLKNLSNTIFGVIYVSGFFCSLIAIRSLIEFDTHGMILISMFISIWALDTFAYFVGSILGKRKLYRQVSPNKTWEGAIAGFFGAIIGFAGASHFLFQEIGLLNAIVIGVIIGILGQLGDLFESKLKRDAGVKDSSSLLPGHGGMLDRFDSMLFVAPGVFIYLVAFVV